MLLFVGLEVLRDKDRKDKEKVNRISSKTVSTFHLHNRTLYHGHHLQIRSIRM